MTAVSPSHPAPALHVLVIADPGLPARRARAACEALEDALARELSGPARVTARTELVPITPEHSLDLPGVARLRAEEPDSDVVIVLTEMPRHDAQPLTAELHLRDTAAIVSLPALGVLSSRRRLASLLVACTARILGRPLRAGRRTDVPGRWEETPGEGGRVRLHGPRLRGTLRMIAGMVATNEPWHTAPRLSRALAAALATGAFGIFYTSIWQMAAALSTPRLMLIAALAVGAMTAWLVLSNRLWDRAETQSQRTVLVLYTTSTVLTLLLSVAGLYIVLFALILAGGLIVIDQEFMASILQQPATAQRYLDIAWLSASLGVLAGALGSSFDSSTDLRGLTHGRREALRVTSDD